MRCPLYTSSPPCLGVFEAIIVDVMRCLWWLALPLVAQQIEPARVQSVYLFPMGNGLDQYLAGRLARLGLFQVVADPKKADAVFTDRLGEAFEQRLNELYPIAGTQAGEKKEGAQQAAGEAKQEAYARVSSWGRGRGTVFLVDTRTRAVIWSVYERPKDSSPGQVNRAAERIAQRLKREWKGK